MAEKSPKTAAKGITQLMNLPEEVLGYIFSFVDSQTRNSLWTVNKLSKIAMDSWCDEHTLNLKNAFLDGSRPPLSHLRDCKKKFSHIIFENVSFGFNYEEILLKFCQTARKITYVNGSGYQFDENLFTILAQLKDPQAKELVISDDLLKFMVKNAKDLLKTFGTLKLSVFGPAYMRYKEERLKNVVNETARAWMAAGNVVAFEFFNESDGYLCEMEDNNFVKKNGINPNIIKIIKKREKHQLGQFFIELRKGQMMELMSQYCLRWSDLIEMTADLNLKNIVFSTFSDGSNNIRELLKSHLNIQDLTIKYISNFCVTEEINPTPTENQIFHKLEKVKILNATATFSLSWILFNEFPNLTELHFMSADFFRSEVALKHDELTAMFQNLPNLQMLSLSNDGKCILPSTIWQIPVLVICPQLRYLRISGFFNIDMGVLTTERGINRLEVLDISNCLIDEKFLKKVCQKFPQLQSLDISNCRNINLETFTAACKVLIQLRELHFNGFSNKFLKFAIENVKNWKNLEVLSADNLTMEGKYRTSEITFTIVETEPEFQIMVGSDDSVNSEDTSDTEYRGDEDMTDDIDDFDDDDGMDSQFTETDDSDGEARLTIIDVTQKIQLNPSEKTVHQSAVQRFFEQSDKIRILNLETPVYREAFMKMVRKDQQMD